MIGNRSWSVHPAAQLILGQIAQAQQLMNPLDVLLTPRVRCAGQRQETRWNSQTDIIRRQRQRQGLHRLRRRADERAVTGLSERGQDLPIEVDDADRSDELVVFEPAPQDATEPDGPVQFTAPLSLPAEPTTAGASRANIPGS